ncbi:hypothetical protein QBC45DRAFT_457733, partial [Copromyces sp. CBS 386.78]
MVALPPTPSRNGSPSKAVRDEWKQYYLCSAWKFTDRAVDYLIAKLRDQRIQDADFSWEPKYRWIKAISPVSKQAEIRKFWQELVTEIEQDAYERAEDDIIDYNFTLKRGFKDEMIEYPDGLSESSNDDVDTPSSNGSDEHATHNTFPLQFSNRFPCLGTWTKLEEVHPSLTIQRFLNEDDRLQLQQDTGVEISYDLEKVVYLGAESQDAINEAKEKLDVLLESVVSSLDIQSITPGPDIQFVLYAEGYKDPMLNEFKSDVRYLANIDPKLPSTTLLDPILFPDLSQEYARMYHAGSSIRLCPYNSVLRAHSSLFGPQILERKRNKGRLAPRPVLTTKSERVLIDISIAPVDGLADPVLSGNATDQKVNVNNWLSNVPEDLGSVPTQDALSSRPATPGSAVLAPTASWDMPLISWDMPALVPTQSAKSSEKVELSKKVTKKSIVKDEPLSFDQEKKTKRIQQVLESVLRFLGNGPYLRGEVIVTADFGRVIIPELAENAIAFNGKDTESNGWKKMLLMETLHQIKPGTTGKESLVAGNVCFTKILSTHGSDLETLINVKDEKTSQGLWQKAPSKCWTVYSFHCQLSGKTHDQFLVEITDCADGNFSYTIRGLTQPGCSQKERKPDDKDSINLSFTIDSQFKTTITSVRVLSKWRHLSQDKRSALDITEVEQLEIKCNPARPGMPKSAGEAHAWKTKTRKERLAVGEVQRWYEASVSSLNLEKLLEKNKPLKTGERAGWSHAELKQDGILESICCPALQMLKHMDQVGGLEDNKQEEKPGTAVKRANDRSRVVPGSEPA